MTPNIPPELWLHVTRYITDEDLSRLYSVSSLFFFLGMDVRWGEVLLITRNTSAAMRLLERLQDPYVATKVKRLVLRLTHVKDPAANVEATTSSMAMSRMRRQFRHTIDSFFLRPKKGGDLDSKDKAKDRDRPRPTFDEVMSALIACAPHMTNVRSLNIDSWDLPPSHDLRPLFHAIWRPSASILSDSSEQLVRSHEAAVLSSQGFGRHITYLFLGGNLENYRLLIQSLQPDLQTQTTLNNYYLPNLTELRIELTNNLFRVDQDADLDTLANVLAPWVVALGPKLEALRIWSWAFMDVSAFFEVLVGVGGQRGNAFPVLESLNIRMPFNRSLRDPEGLKTFLWQTSRTMKRLELRLNPSGLPLDPDAEDPLGTWLRECIGLSEPSGNVISKNDGEEDQEDLRPRFDKLSALDLYPTSTQAGMDALLRYIKRAEQTLVELTVRDRYFQPAEARLVVEAAARCSNSSSSTGSGSKFCAPNSGSAHAAAAGQVAIKGNGMKYLRLNVWLLDVGLLDLVAKRMPELERLWLSIGETVGVPEIDENRLSRNAFHGTLKHRRYDNWKLKDITIWQGGQEMDGETMRVLAHSIPSLTSFFGNGHMEVGYSDPEVPIASPNQ